MLDDQGFYLSCEFFLFWVWRFLVFVFLFLICWILFALEKKWSHQGRGKGFCVWVFLVSWVFSFACFHSAVDFKPGLRGFTAKYRILCLSWQVCFPSAGAPCALFVLGRTALCTTKRSKAVPPAHGYWMRPGWPLPVLPWGGCRSRARGFGERLMCAS